MDTFIQLKYIVIGLQSFRSSEYFWYCVNTTITYFTKLTIIWTFFPWSSTVILLQHFMFLIRRSIPSSFYVRHNAGNTVVLVFSSFRNKYRSRWLHYCLRWQQIELNLNAFTFIQKPWTSFRSSIDVHWWPQNMLHNPANAE